MNPREETHRPSEMIVATPEKCPVSRQSKGEERLNVLTHGAGVVLSVVGLLILVLTSLPLKNTSLIVSCCVFGAALLLTYTASTLYHSWDSTETKRVWRIVDHLSIYVLIAGTYTPFALLGLKGSRGWTLFGFVWGVALVGIVVKFVFGQRFQKLETLLYLAMGWSAIVVIGPLKANLPATGFAFLVAGGLTYSVGVIFYVWKRMPYNHAVWHLFVLGGSVCHFMAVGYSFFPPGAWAWF